MDVALWIAQGVLAAVFLMAGGTKLMKSKAELAEQMGWVEHFSERALKGIGLVEVLAAIGLVLPGIIGTAPIVVPLAAAGLAIAQLIAARLHMRRSELQIVATNVLLVAVAVFIAWGRFGDYPL